MAKPTDPSLDLGVTEKVPKGPVVEPLQFKRSPGEGLDESGGGGLVGVLAPAPVQPIPATDEDNSQKITQIKNVQGFATQRNPEEAAKVLRYARESGIDFETAEAQYKIGPVAPDKQADWGALVKDHPILAQALADDPGLAAAAHDDTENLAWTEKWFGHFSDAAWTSVQNDKITQRLAEIGRYQMDGQATPDMLEEANRLEYEQQHMPQLGHVSNVVGGVTAMAPFFWRIKSRIAAGAATGAAGGAMAFSWTGPGALAAGAAGGVGGAGLGLALGGGEDAYFTEKGLAYREYLKMPGATPETAKVAAEIVGIANGALNVIPMEKILNLAPGLKSVFIGKGTRDLMRRVFQSNTGRAALSRLVGRAAGAGVTMALVSEGMELSRIAGGLGAAGSFEGTGWTRDEIWNRLKSAPVQGFEQGVGLGLLHAIPHFHGDMREVEQAANRVELYKALGDLSSNSKLRERLPNEYKAYVNSLISEYGTVKEAKAPAENLRALFQKEGITDDIVARDMPDVARQLKDAKPTDEIVIPMQDLATHLAPLKSFPEIHENLRIADEPTPKEAQAIKAEVEKMLKQEAEQPKAPAEGGPPPLPGEKVYEDVYQKAKNAGMSDRASAVYATVWRSFAEARGERTGEDPFKYYAKRNLEVTPETIVRETVAAKEESGTPLTPEQVTLRDRALKGDKAAVEALLGQLQRDELTGANNADAWRRFAPQDDTGEFMNPQEGAYLAIDANDLKRANDTFGGHTAGDAYLKTLGSSVAEPVRRNRGKFFRSGGDEFMAHFRTPEEAKAALTEITKALNEAPGLFEGKFRMSISAGIAADPKAADVASFEAKKGARAAGRSGFGRPGSVEVMDFSKGDVFSHVDEASFQKQREPVKTGKELRQEADQGYRGKITFDDTRKWFKMTLTGKANLSTFLHESGHAFLEILRDDATNGHEGSAKDIRLIEEWMKIEPGKEMSEKHLESFARAFEGYLMEGKAPSGKLAEVFRTVAEWMKHIYRTMKGLNVELTDEVRGVFDRMLATDDEIATAVKDFGFEPAPPGKEMTPAEHRAYLERFNKAMAEARDEATRSAVHELRRNLSDEYQKINSDVREMTKTDKRYNTWEELNGRPKLDGSEPSLPEDLRGKKLSREAVAEILGEGAGRQKAKLRGLTEAGGLDPETAAPYFGFNSGEEMVGALAGLPGRAGFERAETDRRMAEKYPGYSGKDVRGFIRAEVQKAVHTDRVGDVLWSEAQGVARKVGAENPKSARDVLRQYARRSVGEMTYLEMQPGRFERAEQRAAKEWADAYKKGDFQAAHTAKMEQLKNHYLWREVTAARDEIDNIHAHLKGTQDLSAQKRLGKAGQQYREAVNLLLEGVDLQKRTAKEIARRDSLEKYLSQMEAEGAVITIPPEIRAGVGLKNYKQMTLGELRAIRDSVANIEAQATLKNKLIMKGVKRDFERTTTQLAEHVTANVGADYGDKPGQRQNPSWWDERKEFFRTARANLTKIEFLARALDGGETAGWAHELLFQPIADAETRKMQMAETISKKLNEPFKNMSTPERLSMDRFVDFLGWKLRKREVIALILNLGNEGNKKKLIEGYGYRGWTEEKVMKRVNELHADGTLTAKDIDLVEHLWKTVGSLWPEIKGLAERVTGVAPGKVEAMPFTIGDRTLEGGYYPVVYDRLKSHKAEQISQRKTGDLFENNFLLPAVEKGFTEGRTEFTAPINLTLDVVPQHINEVIHYLTHYEAVRNVDRITSNAKVRTAITEGVGREAYNSIRPWLQAIAADGAIHENVDFVDRTLRRLRLGSSIAVLGFKVTTGIKQVFGLSGTMKEIGPKYTGLGVAKFMERLSKGEPFKELNELSPALKGMDEHFDRDMGQMFDRMTGYFSEFGHIKDRLAHFSLAWIMLNQKVVNAVTWYGAHEKALSEGHPRPADYADSVVRMAQSSGNIKDLAMIQRGSETKKMFTVMYTYFSTLANQLGEPLPKSASGARKVGIMAARWWWLVTLPVLLDLGKKAAPQDNEDATDYAERLAKEQVLYAGRSVPLFGEAAQAVLSDREVRYGAWYGTMMRGLMAAGKTAREGDASKAEVRSMVDLLGAAGGAPTGAAQNAYRYMDALTSGSMEEPVQNLLFRSPSEWE